MTIPGRRPPASAPEDLTGHPLWLSLLSGATELGERLDPDVQEQIDRAIELIGLAGFDISSLERQLLDPEITTSSRLRIVKEVIDAVSDIVGDDDNVVATDEKALRTVAARLEHFAKTKAKQYLADTQQSETDAALAREGALAALSALGPGWELDSDDPNFANNTVTGQRVDLTPVVEGTGIPQPVLTDGPIRGAPIGVNQGFESFVPHGPVNVSATLSGLDGPVFQGGDDRYVAPEFFDGDQVNKFRGIGTEDILALQAQLVTLGLMTQAQAAAEAGEWRSGSANAIVPVLAHANRFGFGSNWLAALKDYASTTPSPQDQGSQLAPSVFRRRDFDDIALEVEQTFRQQLGREPAPGELSQLVASLQQTELAQFNALEEARQVEHGAQQAAALGATPQKTEAVVVPNPSATFQRVFAEKYQPEADINTAVSQGIGARSNIMQSILTMDTGSGQVGGF